MSYVLTVPVRAHTIIAAYMIILQRLGPVTSTSLHSAQQFVYCRVFRFVIIIVRKFLCLPSYLQVAPPQHSPPPPKGPPKVARIVRPTTTPKLHTKPAPRQTHQQPRTPQQTSQFTQGGHERKQQEGADSETFFSSLVEYFKIS